MFDVGLDITSPFRPNIHHDTAKALIQTGSSGWVPVPPEKRFLINSLRTGRERHQVKSYRKELFFNTGKRRELINITSEVDQCLAESGIREGLALVNAMP